MPLYLNSTVILASLLSFLPRWRLTPLTATGDNNDGRQNDSSQARATEFLNRPSATLHCCLKDTLTLTYYGIYM